jgi:hypothetical protein
MLMPVAYAQSIGPNGGMLAGKDGHETELLEIANDDVSCSYRPAGPLRK